MLEHLGHAEAARVLERTIEAVLRDSDVKTPDMGGKATTVELGQTLEQAVKAALKH
jgi:tartrate dehydrogenase/decarboxylase/D-malate dehydrogenase